MKVYTKQQALNKNYEFMGIYGKELADVQKAAAKRLINIQYMIVESRRGYAVFAEPKYRIMNDIENTKAFLDKAPNKIAEIMEKREQELRELAKKIMQAEDSLKELKSQLLNNSK